MWSDFKLFMFPILASMIPFIIGFLYALNLSNDASIEKQKRAVEIGIIVLNNRYFTIHELSKPIMTGGLKR